MKGFFVIPGARLLHTPSLLGPLKHICDLEAGYEGRVLAPNFLVGRQRDLNPGPPACESGVVAITLRGPPLIRIFISKERQ